MEVRGEENHLQVTSQSSRDEDGNTTWVEPLVTARPMERYFGDRPLLEGTEACLTWGAVDDDSSIPSSCYEASLRQPSGDEAIDAPGCRVFAEGETTWSFTPVPCEHNSEIAPREERVTLTAIPATETQPRLVPWPEILAAAAETPFVLSDGLGGDLPEGFTAPYGPTLLVAEDQPVRLNAYLTEEATGGWVAWNRGLAVAELRGLSGRAEIVDDAPTTEVGLAGIMDFQRQGPGPDLRVVLGPDAEADLVVELGETSWTAARLTAIDPAEATSLEVVVAPSGPTLAARAFATTASGELIHGAPVRWSFVGLTMAIGTADDEHETWAGPDYVDLADTCSPPERRVGERTGTLVARLGDLRAEAAVSWTNAQVDESETEDWVRPEQCVPSGCSGCTSAAGSGAGAWGLLAGLLGWAIRRPRRPH